MGDLKHLTDKEIAFRSDVWPDQGRFLSAYRDDMLLAGYSEGSIYGNIRVAVRYLDDSAGAHLNPKSREAILSFIDGPYDPNSKVYYFNRIKGLFLANGWPWPMRNRQGPKGKTNDQPSMSDDEVRKLLEAVKSNLRLSAALTLIATLGLRGQDLSNINRDDYRRPKLRIETAKHGSVREVELDKNSCDILDRYLRQRSDDSLAMFTNAKGQRVEPGSLYAQFAKICSRLGIKRPKLGLHSLRRFLITGMYRNGAQLLDVQHFIGHKRLDTTAHYVRLDPGEAERRVKKFHPLLASGAAPKKSAGQEREISIAPLRTPDR